MSTLRALHSTDSGPAAAAPCGDEREWIERARHDGAAWTALYRRHAPVIQRYLWRRLGDEHLVEDAVAETFASAWESLDRFEDRGGSLLPWLYRIASRRAARIRRRAATLAIAGLDEEPVADEPRSTPRAKLARAALLRLPERFQSVLALHYLEGLSIDEVAATVGCRPGTVKSRLARGRERLRRELERMEARS